MQVSKPRGINADIQSPRTKLLYLIYTAPGGRIKAEPGVKSNICSALGYKSDGHFHYDWNYLETAGMIEEKQGYYMITEGGRREFALQAEASRSNLTMVLIGIAALAFTVGLQFELVPVISVAAFGAVLIVVGALFLLVDRRHRPALPSEARVLLKELSHH